VRNPLVELSKDVWRVGTWGRDVVRYGGNAALERLKDLNPRRTQAQNIAVVHGNNPANAPQPDQRVLSETETTQPVVWRAIEVPAEDASKVPVNMFKGTLEARGDQIVGDQHPMLDLLHRPAPDVSPLIWRQNIYADVRAAGDWFSYVYMGPNGLPSSFARFMPSEITPKPDLSGKRLISHYEWNTLQGNGLLGLSGPGAQVPVPVDDMAHIKTRNPDTEIRGLGALARLRFQIGMDSVMQTWNWGRYAQGIPTQYMVFFNGQFAPGQRQIVERDLRAKLAQPGADPFWLIEGNGDGVSEFKVEQFPRPTEDELAFLDSEQRIAYRIIMAMGVPPLKIMDLSQSSVVANSDVQERLYWEDTIPSLVGHYIEFLNAFARKYYFGFGPVFFEADYSGVRALKKSELDQMNTFTGYAREGVLTRNEVREALGYEKHPEPLMDEPLVNGRKLGGPDLSSLFGPGGMDTGEDPEDKDDPDDEMTEFPGEEDDEEEKGAKVVAMRRLKGFEHLAGMIDIASEKKLFDRAVRRKILAMIRQSGQETLELAGVVGTFDMTSPKVFEFLETQIVALVNEKLSNVNEAVRSAIADGVAQGTPIDSMRSMVQDALIEQRQPYQLDRIARTEVHQAQEGGGQLSAEQNGVEFKQWVSSRDSKVRGIEADDDADHLGIEAIGPIPIKLAYQDPRSGAHLMFPGDRAGDGVKGTDTINCRCASVPDFSHLEKALRPTKRKSLDDQWFAKATTAGRFERDFKRTLKSYLRGLQARALERFDELAEKGANHAVASR